MNAEEIIEYIRTSEKKTPVKVYLNEKEEIAFPGCKVFGSHPSKVIFGEWKILSPILEQNADKIEEIEIENDRRNSAIPLLDMKNINARIEPGVTIREQVEIGDNAVIMMGAVINIGCVIGKGTMIDMGVVMGGRVIVGEHCHVGAGAVLAGVVEPASATPVTLEDDVMIGANAVVLEGCRIGKGAVVAAGAVVISDVPAGVVVAGTPARIIKQKDERTMKKTELVDALRTL
ncbi:2,3,4,5-tetrahydropyridine-2,6-dicarboxylate N-acetyltransferase [Acidaminobacterium chupaoyuni]